MSMDLSESDRNWIAGKFGIDVNEIVTHHSGNCYDRCIVRSMAAAEKVKAAVANHQRRLHARAAARQHHEDRRQSVFSDVLRPHEVSARHPRPESVASTLAAPALSRQDR
jgi:hypothetical protein